MFYQEQLGRISKICWSKKLFAIDLANAVTLQYLA